MNPKTSTQLLFLLLILTISAGYAQAPNISYPTPETYMVNVPAPVLTPTNIGGPVPTRAPVTIATGFNDPRGIFRNAAGDLYVADYGNNAVKEIPAGSSTPVTIGSGFNHPGAVTLDAAGNIYVTDNGNGLVKEILAGTGTIITLGSGFTSPYGITLDAAGNIYVSDVSQNVVKKIAVGGVVTTTYATGFNQPHGIVMDAAGNLYVANTGAKKLVEVAAGATTPTIINGGWENITDVAVDAAGNLYVADSMDILGVYKIPAGTKRKVSLGPDHPGGVAVDSQGNVYETETHVGYVSVRKFGGYAMNNAPTGFSFNPDDGTIFVNPKTAAPATTYKVTATNVDGSSTANIRITVLPLGDPTISYKSPQVYTQGTAITPLVPKSVGVAAPNPDGIVLIAYPFSNLTGIALDASNNVYAAEDGANDIKKVAASGGIPVVIGTGFTTPTGVAVDGTGNVFVADFGNNAIKEIAAGSGATTTLVSGLNGPYGIAVAAGGNLYFSDFNNNQVKKLAAGTTTPVVIGTGFSHPAGVAVDAAGNVYVADRGNNAIKEILEPAGTITTLAAGNGNPNGVAVDAAGDVYFADTHNTNIVKIPAGGGSVTTVGSGFNTPTGVALDASGVVYVADNGNGAIKAIKIAGGYFVSPALPAGLSLDATTGTISGTPTATSAATDYTVTGYNSFGSGNATVNITVRSADAPNISYSTPQVYTVNTAITPLTPTNTGGAVPNWKMPTVLGTGFSTPRGIGLDAAGNVYFADDANNAIKEIPAGGGTPVVIGSGFITPTDVAVDAAGNIFVVDNGNHVVKEIPVGGGSIVSIGSGFSNPYGLAIDAAGNLFITDLTLNAVLKIAAGTGTTTTVATGFNSPHGLAVDAAGDVFVANTGTKKVLEVAAGTSTPVIVVGGFGNLVDVAVDGAGNLYTADADDVFVEKIPAGTKQKDPAALQSECAGITVDANKTIFTTGGPGPGNGNVHETQYGEWKISGLPAGLAFDDSNGVISGTPTTVTAAKNYRVTATNGAGSSTFAINITVQAAPTDMLRSAFTKTFADSLNTADVLVHPGITPNGDGKNDVLTIDNISAYPNNKVIIMSRSGVVVYEATGYDNAIKVFDGHSNKTGELLYAGTYFYSLEYTSGGVPKKKTGFIVLKY